MRAHIVISGRVQGVLYRRFAQVKAEELGITGWAHNMIDGRVELMAEGDKEKVDQFVEWCKQGSPLAKVQDVEITYKEYTGEFTDFEVREFGF